MLLTRLISCPVNKFILQNLQDLCVECQIIVICLSRYNFEWICTFLCMTNCIILYVFNVYKVRECVCPRIFKIRAKNGLELYHLLKNTEKNLFEHVMPYILCRPGVLKWWVTIPSVSRYGGKVKNPSYCFSLFASSAKRNCIYMTGHICSTLFSHTTTSVTTWRRSFQKLIHFYLF